MKRTGPTNPLLRKLIRELGRKKEGIWKRVAQELSRSSRQRREVNISKLERHCKEGETVIVPGKVLGSGGIKKKLTVAALGFSRQAREKIERAGGRCMSIEELFKQCPKEGGVRLIG